MRTRNQQKDNPWNAQPGRYNLGRNAGGDHNAHHEQKVVRGHKELFWRS
ncbi:MAG: hypothetical protein H0T53_12040 [Herpetosiphonaceae bacterium]|nr:hypothetical protein [Herpetosiphonaceae bacterium]